MIQQPPPPYKFQHQYIEHKELYTISLLTSPNKIKFKIYSKTDSKQQNPNHIYETQISTLQELGEFKIYYKSFGELCEQLVSAMKLHNVCYEPQENILKISHRNLCQFKGQINEQVSDVTVNLKLYQTDGNNSEKTQPHSSQSLASSDSNFCLTSYSYEQILQRCAADQQLKNKQIKNILAYLLTGYKSMKESDEKYRSQMESFKLALRNQLNESKNNINNMNSVQNKFSDSKESFMDCKNKKQFQEYLSKSWNQSFNFNHNNNNIMQNICKSDTNSPAVQIQNLKKRYDSVNSTLKFIQQQNQNKINGFLIKLNNMENMLGNSKEQGKISYNFELNKQISKIKNEFQKKLTLLKEQQRSFIQSKFNQLKNQFFKRQSTKDDLKDLKDLKDVKRTNSLLQFSANSSAFIPFGNEQNMSKIVQKNKKSQKQIQKKPTNSTLSKSIQNESFNTSLENTCSNFKNRKSSQSYLQQFSPIDGVTSFQNLIKKPGIISSFATETNQNETWVDTNCYYMKNISMESDDLIIAKDWAKIFGKQVITTQKSLKFKLLKLKKLFGIGIIDSAYSTRNSHKGIANRIYYANNGCFRVGNEWIEQKGKGFKQNDEVTMYANVVEGIIIWYVNDREIFKIKCQDLQDRSINWVPMVWLNDKGDAIRRLG